MSTLSEKLENTSKAAMQLTANTQMLKILRIAS